MITKFDSLFAGHADLDNVGYAGTPINERRYPNAHLATALSKAEAMARLMDGLGYNCFWLAEHHFQSEGTECIPNAILMALHLAHQTRNIKIGCGFNITPMSHPLRLAEDFAMADILTGGRIVFGGAAWNRLVDHPWRIMSIGLRQWSSMCGAYSLRRRITAYRDGLLDRWSSRPLSGAELPERF